MFCNSSGEDVALFNLMSCNFVTPRCGEERRLLLGREEMLHYLREKKRRALPSTSKRVRTSSQNCHYMDHSTALKKELSDVRAKSRENWSLAQRLYSVAFIQGALSGQLSPEGSVS